MNNVHPTLQEALAPFAPPASLNGDDAYIVDLAGNRVIRQCSRELARSGISVTLGHAVMTGMQARGHIEREGERRRNLHGKTSQAKQLRNVLAYLDEAVRAGILDGTEVEQQFGDIRRTLGKDTGVAA